MNLKQQVHAHTHTIIFKICATRIYSYSNPLMLRSYWSSNQFPTITMAIKKPITPPSLVTLSQLSCTSVGFDFAVAHNMQDAGRDFHLFLSLPLSIRLGTHWRTNVRSLSLFLPTQLPMVSEDEGRDSGKQNQESEEP